MKIIIYILALISLNITKEKTLSEIRSFTINPIETDVKYAEKEKKHYIVSNSKNSENKLVLFIGGSFSTPKNYNIICNHIANLGFDVISLSYLNNVPAGALAKSSDNLIFDKYREEICFGNPISNEVKVDTLNSIETRTVKLIQFLDKKQPNKNWSQYLKNNSINWNKIIVAGHSQGAGHACYLAKKNQVDRVVMFAGPNDFNSKLNQAANWLSVDGKTSLKQHFALLHEKDEVIKYDYQVRNLRSLGLLNSNQNPVTADNLSSPYNNANVLSLNIKGLSNHTSVVGSNKSLPKIWTYLFTLK